MARNHSLFKRDMDSFEDPGEALLRKAIHSIDPHPPNNIVSKRILPQSGASVKEWACYLARAS
ncbi:hypothetical protein VKA52_00885 [Halobacillus sp. HZG1]|nr:hypothetical protein [Halobacillus sp. HZG1]